MAGRTQRAERIQSLDGSSELPEELDLGRGLCGLIAVAMKKRGIVQDRPAAGTDPE
jgi:hypothetical protein